MQDYPLTLHHVFWRIERLFEPVSAQAARHGHLADPADAVQRGPWASTRRGKAAAAVAALQKMMIITARVRRDGQLAEIPAGQLVPGDIVAIEAGEIVPADGRLLTAATLEVAESALTGESLPVTKSADAVAGLGHAARRPDRHGVHEHQRHPRRGRVRGHRDRDGPEVGQISGMLAEEQDVKTPLTRQMDRLSKQILVIAGIALVASMEQ